MTVLSWCLHLFQFQNEGLGILRELESQCLSEISSMLNGEISGQDLGELFFDCVDAEIKFYQWGGEMISPQIPKHSLSPWFSCSFVRVALVFSHVILHYNWLWSWGPLSLLQRPHVDKHSHFSSRRPRITLLIICGLRSSSTHSYRVSS